MNEIDLLRNLYIEHLTETVNWTGINRPRVKHPGKWSNLNTVIKLKHGIPLSLKDKKVWVWSDQHFSHKDIIDFSNRPYLNISEMNYHLIENYNDYVKPNDVSIWVGDVGFGSDKNINDLLNQCNGYKILVIGNHDFNGKKIRNLDFDEIHLIYQLDVTLDFSLVFTHYPMNNISLPWFNVHGHLHAYPKPDTGNVLHYNVCCELHDYRPVELEKITKIAKMRLIG